jgi:hypothetical protein
MLNHVVFLLLAAFLFTACGRGQEQEADAAEDADESATVTFAEAALTTELSDEVAQPLSATGEALAQSAATRVLSRMTPAGCVVASQQGATVTYVLTNCTGPWGLVKVSGTLTAVYSRGQGGAVQVVITGNGMKANDATFDVNATITASQAAGVKRAEVTSASKGTGPRGAPIERQGNYTVTWNAATGCLTLEGTWETKVGQRSWTTTVTSFKKCAGACPAAGGSIVVSAARLTVTLTYDGTSTAAWTANNRSGNLKLLCGG